VTVDSVALLTIKGQNVLTHSRTQAFGKCRRLHHLRYNLGIRPKTDAKPLRIGSVIHEALDLHAKGKWADEAIMDAVSVYDEVPTWADTDELVHEWLCEAALCRAMLSAYFAHYANIELPPELRVAEIVNSEIDFELAITNPDTGSPIHVFKNRGKIDKIVRLADGRVAIMEHKTTSDSIEPGADYWLRLCVDQQISRYMCAAQDLGYDPQTILYDVISKPKHSPRAIPLTDENGVKIVLDTNGDRVRTSDGKKWRETGDSAKGYAVQTRPETPDEFMARVRDEMLADPSRFFARREVPRLTSDLNTFRQELYQQAKDIHEANKTGRHFRNSGSCIGFGRCEYLDLCASGTMPTRENPPSGFVMVEDLHPELASTTE
jgi:RecB family exonuclease